MKLSQFVANVRTSFIRVKNDMTDLTLRSNQLALDHADLTKRVAFAEDELVVLRRHIAELKDALVSRRTVTIDAPRIIRTTTTAKKLFVGSLTGGKVHVPDCPFAKNIRAKNKVFFNSRIKALRKGYKECTCMR